MTYKEEFIASLLPGERRLCNAVLLGHRTFSTLKNCLGITSDTLKTRIDDMTYKDILRLDSDGVYRIVFPKIEPPKVYESSIKQPTKKQLMAGNAGRARRAR